MRYIISEAQNEKLKKYSAIKDLVDSFEFEGLIRTEFDLNFNNDFGFYEIEPTFHFDYWKMGPWARQKSSDLKTILSSDLCQRIEDFLGIHIVSHKSYLYIYKS